MGQTDQSHLLTLPPNIGRLIVETGAVFARPLLAANNFVSFCKDRNLNIDRERLFRFERLGIFAPVFRVRTPNDDIPPFFFPVRKENNWFDKGLAWDTTSLGAHEIPDESDQTQEAYYSIFQIDHLSSVIREMTLETHMDAYLESQDSETIDLPKNEWLELFRHHLDSLQMHEYRRSIPLLCQFISERFYPHARGDQRSIQVTHSSYSDHWINAYQKDFDWHKFARAWDSKPTETLFNLTQAKLSHAYKTLDFAQQHLDPLERWYQLVQFVSVNQRDRLKLDALCAETICEGAQMLRLLHKSLYKEELPQPNETTGTIITHFPELAIRRDVRRHLEFV
ncbi:MAG: hypothetical protein QOJ96_596, partial [Alphaproteobacteria bacterium]|nr:hypothetical protein [Alphaproteobacteria bacterium]